MNQLILWNDIRLFYGSHPREVAKNSHPTVQLIVAVNGTFRSKDESGNWEEKTGLLISPNHSHVCDASNVPIISIDIDPESTLGEWILKNQLNGHPVIDYPSMKLGNLDFKEFSVLINNEDWHAIRRLIENTFLFEKTFKVSEKDDRIEKILDFISNKIDQNITTEMLTEVVFLSESRMLHLFKEKMGLPIRSYILWYRLKIVLEQILEGNALTTAAYKAGFADQAHMTRTFIKMTGVPPSFFAKNSKFVQVSFPE